MKPTYEELVETLKGALNALELYRDHGDAAGEFPLTIKDCQDNINRAEGR